MSTRFPTMLIWQEGKPVAHPMGLEIPLHLLQADLRVPDMPRGRQKGCSGASALLDSCHFFLYRNTKGGKNRDESLSSCTTEQHGQVPFAL